MSDYVCEELIVEILTRLPTKSLVRFISLSKSLCSTISSPGFIRMHSLRARQKLLIRHKTYWKTNYNAEDFYTLHSEDQLPLSLTHGYLGITPVKFPCTYSTDIVGSCNEILCLLDYSNNINLWNPSIRRKLTLPDSPRRSYNRVQIGFGFDPITDDYKIVSISNPEYGRIFVDSTFVYAMKTGAWCSIASSKPLFSEVASKACFVDGALHWLVERHHTQSDAVDRFYILTFDLSTHVFGMIALPAVPRYATKELIAFQGSLAVISTRYCGSSIWVRRDDSWSVFYRTKINELFGGLEGVLQLTSNDDFLCHTWQQEFQVHNTDIGLRSKLVGFTDASRIVDIVLCVESLQLLDTGTACNGSQPFFLKGKKRSNLRRIRQWMYKMRRILKF